MPPPGASASPASRWCACRRIGWRKAACSSAGHHTPELVWQPEHQNHPNHAHSLTDVLLCVEDPAEAADRYQRFLGIPAQARDGFWLFELERGRLHIFDPGSLAQVTGIACPTIPFIAGFALTSADLPATRAFLTSQGVAIRTLAPDVIAVTPDEIATTIVFTAPDATLPWPNA